MPKAVLAWASLSNEHTPDGANPPLNAVDDRDIALTVV
jgi:hypothetical protein